MEILQKCFQDATSKFKCEIIKKQVKDFTIHKLIHSNAQMLKL